jgi:hypothetical protein
MTVELTATVVVQLQPAKPIPSVSEPRTLP